VVSIDKTRENHRPAASHWQTLLYKVVSNILDYAWEVN